ncbi:MAG: DeoR/GlpR family DNA-binding transcription regulator [Sphingomicrobium sp.]
MHASQRETVILEMLRASGFVSFRDLLTRLDASPATLRRDLDRLEGSRALARVHGGIRLPDDLPPTSDNARLTGVPFHENIGRHSGQKQAIGFAAARLCAPGEAVIIDGGSTTLQMCPYLAGLGLQVLTNSLHIVSALLPQATTRIIIPGGTLFREQNIILSALGDDPLPQLHAPKLFMGAAAVGPRGVMQADIILVASERRFIDRAEQLILLVDSSKFASVSGHVVCPLDEINIVITDNNIAADHVKMLEAAGVHIIVAEISDFHRHQLQQVA